MRTNRFFSIARHWLPRSALLVILFALLTLPMASHLPVAHAAPVPLLQFTAGGHVVGFAPTQVVMAAFDHALRVEFVGTAGVTPVASAAASSSDAPTLGRAQPLGIVTYPEVWRGVSIEYRAGEGSIVKSTYTVAPGADVAQIRLRYNVPVELQSDGSLRFSFGRGYVSESAPLAWQEIDGARVPVQVAFRVFDPADANLQPVVSAVEPSEIENRKSEVGFHLGAYDPRYPLTIDPNYVWHTFYGSSDSDKGYGIAVDASGNVYIAGYSRVTWGSPLNPHSGYYDIVVVKLNSAGGYVWHTFYGSSDWDEGYGIAVDTSSNVYITGYSRGWGTPLHPNSGGADIIVIKLNSAGTYQWHTFYGSSGGGEQGYGIAVDTSSNVYVTGHSTSSWLGDNDTPPKNAHSGDRDIVVLKLNSNGAYQWHTFYGSSAWDEGYGIAVDASSYVYVTGYSGNWGSPLNAHSGGSDIVVLKLNSVGAYQWHTFYGSSAWDEGDDIAVDGTGNYVYITGSSGATWGSSPLHAHSGGAEIVVLKLTSAGAYQWHTFYGSSSDDRGNGIAVDASSNVYVTGTSDATWQGDGGTNPLHAYSGWYDIVVLKLTSAGAYQWHTFYGSGGEDRGYGIAVASSNVYVAGYSAFSWQGDSGTPPLNPNSGYDIVALKLGESYTLTVATAGSGSGTVVKTPDAPSYPAGTVVTLTANAASGSYFGGWSGDAGGLTNPLTVTMDANKHITATFRLEGECVPVGGVDFTFAPTAPLVGEPVWFTGTVTAGDPPLTYTWAWGDGTPAGSGAVISHTFPLTHTLQVYTVTLTVSNACPSQATAQRAVAVQPRRVYLPLVLRNR